MARPPPPLVGPAVPAPPPLPRPGGGHRSGAAMRGRIPSNVQLVNTINLTLCSLPHLTTAKRESGLCRGTVRRGRGSAVCPQVSLWDPWALMARRLNQVNPQVLGTQGHGKGPCLVLGSLRMSLVCATGREVVEEGEGGGGGGLA